MFPILGRLGDQPRKIPFAWVTQFNTQYVINHCGQSLATLARRGGLNWTELWAGMKGTNPFNKTDPLPAEATCKAEVLADIEAWNHRKEVGSEHG